jgi:hypothetical protein
MENVVINGVEYAPVQKGVNDSDGLPWVIVRAYSAGVFAGYLKSKDGDEVTLVNSRRIWTWYGAASLSQLAQEGVKKPKDCKIAMVEPIKTIKGRIEITPGTEAAKKSIDGVAEWKM